MIVEYHGKECMYARTCIQHLGPKVHIVGSRIGTRTEKIYNNYRKIQKSGVSLILQGTRWINV